MSKEIEYFRVNRCFFFSSSHIVHYVKIYNSQMKKEESLIFIQFRNTLLTDESCAFEIRTIYIDTIHL